MQQIAKRGLPQAQLAERLGALGISIGRGFPPLANWTPITIGTAAENLRVQAALRSVLRA